MCYTRHVTTRSNPRRTWRNWGGGDRDSTTAGISGPRPIQYSLLCNLLRSRSLFVSVPGFVKSPGENLYYSHGPGIDHDGYCVTTFLFSISRLVGWQVDHGSANNRNRWILPSRRRSSLFVPPACLPVCLPAQVRSFMSPGYLHRENPLRGHHHHNNQPTCGS